MDQNPTRRSEISPSKVCKRITEHKMKRKFEVVFKKEKFVFKEMMKPVKRKETSDVRLSENKVIYTKEEFRFLFCFFA